MLVWLIPEKYCGSLLRVFIVGYIYIYMHIHVPFRMHFEFSGCSCISVHKQHSVLISSSMKFTVCKLPFWLASEITSSLMHNTQQVSQPSVWYSDSDVRDLTFREYTGYCYLWMVSWFLWVALDLLMDAVRLLIQQVYISQFIFLLRDTVSWP